MRSRLAGVWSGGPQGGFAISSPTAREVSNATELVAFLRDHGASFSPRELTILGSVYTFFCMRECSGSDAGFLMSRIGKYQDQFFPEIADDSARSQLNSGFDLLNEAIFPVRSDYDHVVIDKAFLALQKQLAPLKSIGGPTPP